MAKIEINRITNANIYLDGANLLGRAEEVKLPDVSMTMQEHKALGMVGKVELPAGFDKLEGEIKWNSFYRDAMLSAANPYKSLALQCRSSVQRYSSQGLIDEIPLVTFLTIMFKKNPLGTFKRKRLVRTVLIFTESSDQLSRATDRVPGLPASPGYVQ